RKPVQANMGSTRGAFEAWRRCHRPRGAASVANSCPMGSHAYGTEEPRSSGVMAARRPVRSTSAMNFARSGTNSGFRSRGRTTSSYAVVAAASHRGTMTSDDEMASWNERADRFCQAWSSDVGRPDFDTLSKIYAPDDDVV